MTYEIEHTDKQILIHRKKGTYTLNKTDEETDKLRVNDYIAMFEREDFYESKHFINEFNEKLETAILATRHSGSGAAACRDTLLSLYNGSVYKANLSNWYSLDSTNRAALLFILEHQTANNRQDIDLYLAQYQNDFTRMKAEIKDND